MSSWDWDAGYDRADPKHPSYAEAWRGLCDDARKRAKENAAPVVRRASDPVTGAAAPGEGDDPGAGAAS